MAIRRNTKREQAPGWRLERVELRGLFSKYDFPNLAMSHATESGADLTLLYGENGAGKTTILKLIYAALSAERNAGNRGYLGSTAFQLLALYFEDGQQLRIERQSKKTTGHYEYIFEGPRIERRIRIFTESNGKVGERRNPEIDELSDILEAHFPPIVFLNDHRTFKTSFGNPAPDFLVEREIRHGIYRDHIRRSRHDVDNEGDLEGLANLSLENLLSRARVLLSSGALRGTARANEGSGQVYLSAAKTIATPQRKKAADKEKISSEELIHQIDNLLPTIEKFSKVGLKEGESVREIRSTVASARGVKKEQICELVSPYIASIKSRIEQNLKIVDLATRFQENVNQFLRRKHVEVDIGEDIRILDDEGVEISVQSLSSGERQILNLCTVGLLSSQANNIIMIDEPEISLNYKWQKQLVNALLEIAGQSSQFIMATHSFEIIGNHRSCLQTIEPA